MAISCLPNQPNLHNSSASSFSDRDISNRDLEMSANSVDNLKSFLTQMLAQAPHHSQPTTPSEFNNGDSLFSSVSRVDPTTFSKIPLLFVFPEGLGESAQGLVRVHSESTFFQTPNQSECYFKPGHEQCEMLSNPTEPRFTHVHFELRGTKIASEGFFSFDPTAATSVKITFRPDPHASILSHQMHPRIEVKDPDGDLETLNNLGFKSHTGMVLGHVRLASTHQPPQKYLSGSKMHQAFS